MTLLGNPTRKRGIRCIFLAYASGYQVFKQHHFVPAALGLSVPRLTLRETFPFFEAGLILR